MKMFLDDVRNPQQVYPDEVGWTIVRSFNEAVEVIESACMCPNHISFDHDLAADHYSGKFDGPEKTGYEFANWLVNKDLDMKGQFIPKDFTFRVHSMNPEGAANIRSLLTNYINFRNHNENAYKPG